MGYLLFFAGILICYAKDRQRQIWVCAFALPFLFQCSECTQASVQFATIPGSVFIWGGFIVTAIMRRKIIQRGDKFYEIERETFQFTPIDKATEQLLCGKMTEPVDLSMFGSIRF